LCTGKVGKPKGEKKMKNKWMTLYGIILTIAAVGQIIAAVLFYDPTASAAVINTGWGVMMVSAIFGWLPIVTFRRKGKVEGRGYIHTTKLVDSGVYSIVRHPQYLAGILLNIALVLITQHWLVAVLGLIAIIVNYLDTFTEEENCIEKFGDAYRQYMDKVPRLNFILGIIRKIRRG
jgi:protein-S-isoprenylcysteine O-methyltransferase Ste14